MSYKSNLNRRLIVAVILTIVGSGLLIAGFIVPPLGIIDSSVLVAFGEVAVFAGSLFGIDLHYKMEFHKFKSDIGVDRDDKAGT